MEVAEILMQ